MRKATVEVVVPSGATERWSIAFLSSRCGEPNTNGSQDVPSTLLDAYFDIPQGMYAHLLAHMAIDVGVTFIGMVDGVPGILFEAECLTQEVDGEDEQYDDLTLLDRDALNEANCLRLKALAIDYPEARLAIAPQSMMWDQRAGAWAFIPHDKLCEDRVEALAEIFCEMQSY